MNRLSHPGSSHPRAFWRQGLAVPLLALLVALTASGSAATLKKDIEYGSAGGMRLLLDASVPDGQGPFPVAILIHGGGWGSGDKSGTDVPNSGADITPWFAPLTEANFTWFSINYRLAPASRWPACFDDVQTAIRWVKAHAAEFKGDPGRIVLFGHSAGGHLAFLSGVLSDEATRVQAVVGFAPVTDFEFDLQARGGLSTALQNLLGRPKEATPESLARLREISPINRVRAGLPPFLILQGDADKTVPMQATVNFRDKLVAAGNTCDFWVIPRAPHRLKPWIECDPTYPGRLVAWLRQKLGSGAN